MGVAVSVFGENSYPRPTSLASCHRMRPENVAGGFQQRSWGLHGKLLGGSKPECQLVVDELLACNCLSHTDYCPCLPLSSTHTHTHTRPVHLHPPRACSPPSLSLPGSLPGALIYIEHMCVFWLGEGGQGSNICPPPLPGYACEWPSRLAGFRAVMPGGSDPAGRGQRAKQEGGSESKEQAPGWKADSRSLPPAGARVCWLSPWSCGDNRPGPLS